MVDSTKRYDGYPALADLARSMPEEARRLVMRWHTAMMTGFQGYIVQVPRELATARHGGRVESALWCLRAWQQVLQDMAAVLVDTRPADWCCKRGAAAWPGACPQHGAADPESLALGTVLGSVVGERAVKVVVEDGFAWRSVEFANYYTDSEVVGWTVVGL